MSETIFDSITNNKSDPVRTYLSSMSDMVDEEILDKAESVYNLTDDEEQFEVSRLDALSIDSDSPMDPIFPIDEVNIAKLEATEDIEDFFDPNDPIDIDPQLVKFEGV